MKAAIEIKNYSFRYANTNKNILNNCNFTLNYGEFVVLSGHSGTGKSTLLSSINGIIPNISSGVQDGAIYIHEKNINGMKISEISNMVGSVLQNADNQIFHAKVEDEISFGCENRGFSPEIIEKKIKSACKDMKLNPNDSTKNLSGGQKQRLITASTLAMGQKILVFDEPLANLDLEGSHHLLSLLRKKVDEENYAVLFIEHRLDMVIPYADKIAWLKNGQIQLTKSNDEILSQNMNLIPDTGKLPISNTPCFNIDHVTYSIKELEILKDISFSVKQGERIVILGENGCGKTTLLRLIARLLKPTTGEIFQYIKPELSKKASAQWFQLVGYVYQNPSYQLFMSDVLSEVTLQSKSQQESLDLLKDFDLETFAEQHPQSLSEGQKRKLTIASVLNSHPKLLLLDEPTVGQDYESLKKTIDYINHIHKKENTTILTVTHDYRCAGALADRVIWMLNGQIYKSGSPTLITEYFTQNLTKKETTEF